jgi:RNA polymerase sigma factor (sigma-70 family)
VGEAVTDNDILREYLPWLRAVAANLTSPSDPDLQDLVQEGYIAAWKALKSYDSAQGPLDYWLKYKAHGRMKTLAIRGYGKEASRSLDEVVAGDLGPATLGDTLESLDGAELLEQVDMAYHSGEVADAISRLTPSQRRYVAARFWLGLSGKEMRELGVFSYDPSALWNQKKCGARWKLGAELAHLRS